MNVVKGALLLVGGALIIASSIFTLGHLNDRVVFTVLVPGVVLGLISIVIAMRLGPNRWHWFGD